MKSWTLTDKDLPSINSWQQRRITGIYAHGTNLVVPKNKTDIYISDEFDSTLKWAEDNDMIANINVRLYCLN